MHKLKNGFLKRTTVFPTVIGFMVVVLTPSIANASISNGTFETETGTAITGWTAINKRIDLGGELIAARTSEDVVSTIAGCATVDTSNYSNLRDWNAPFKGSDFDVPNTPEANNDSYELLPDYDDDDPPIFNTTVVDGSGVGVSASFQRSGNLLKLKSDVNTDDIGGYVVHGPAVYSDTFTAKTIDDLKIDWAADSNGDDYHVFAYLLNTATCEQTEIVDSTGQSSAWRTQSVAVPSNGTYRFVFVAGTFDQSFGTLAGGTMYIDNILLTVNEQRAAEEAARTPSTPASPKIPTFDAFAAGPMTVTPGQDLVLTGSRLSCTTFVEINSQPTSFNFGTLPGGLSQLTIGMPANLTPGPHRMHMDSCGGPVTFENLLVVPKPPAVFEAVARNSIERMLTVVQVQSFVIQNRLDYNHVECIVNASAKNLQTAARQLLGDVCKISNMFLSTSKGSTSELRNTHKPANIWVRVTLSNK